jgi:hypothetical protein
MAGCPRRAVGGRARDDRRAAPLVDGPAVLVEPEGGEAAAADEERLVVLGEPARQGEGSEDPALALEQVGGLRARGYTPRIGGSLARKNGIEAR